MSRRQQGGVLLLFPVAVLIVMLLAAMTVDAAIVFLGQREVSDSVAAAANDAATLGVGNAAFYRAGSVQLDPGTVRALALDRVRTALDAARFQDLTVDAVVVPGAGSCPPSVRVSASATVAYLFTKVVPGAPGRATVTATATAAAAQADTSGC